MDIKLKRNKFMCTAERPYQEGDETPVIHPHAREVDEQENGWPGGDIVTYECPFCKVFWKTELPQ